MEEELFTFSGAESLAQDLNLKQIESECLNLNITCPGDLTRESRLPVMVWIHGCAHPQVHHSSGGYLTSFLCRH
jgi:carboxylesterase type B